MTTNKTAENPKSAKVFLEILEERYQEEKDLKERSHKVLLERFKTALNGKELVLENCSR